jgi:hypothetical protein
LPRQIPGRFGFRHGLSPLSPAGAADSQKIAVAGDGWSWGPGPALRAGGEAPAGSAVALAVGPGDGAPLPCPGWPDGGAADPGGVDGCDDTDGLDRSAVT